MISFLGNLLHLIQGNNSPQFYDTCNQSSIFAELVERAQLSSAKFFPSSAHSAQRDFPQLSSAQLRYFFLIASLLVTSCEDKNPKSVQVDSRAVANGLKQNGVRPEIDEEVVAPVAQPVVAPVRARVPAVGEDARDRLAARRGRQLAEQVSEADAVLALAISGYKNEFDGG